ncbi:MAG: choice-of-anchor B family protein [Bacteroidetes bacterium]|nr:choice-of-anchor B family protein [Bacteroidota bacterium]
MDLADPLNPTYAGEYVYPGSSSDNYVHDGIVENDTMYESHIYPGFFTVVDVRNKSNPVLLATQQTPTNFTHNTWLSDDHKTLFTTDENSGSYLGAYDISDLGNIRELSRSQTAPGSGAIIHNTHILNDYAITSWYKEGVVITDVDRPENPIEVGHYDTYPQGSGDGFNGCWGVYPFLPSGNIVASDIDNGLFVFTPTYVRGCYLEGIITDSVTNATINGALIEVLATTLTKNSNALGEYKTGTVVSGTYDVRVSKAGYYSKTITGVNLAMEY